MSLSPNAISAVSAARRRSELKYRSNAVIASPPTHLSGIDTAARTEATRQAQGCDATIGIELGADVGAHIDLDEFMVFEQNEERARAFFANLFFKHLTSGTDDEHMVSGLRDPSDVIRLGFTDTRALVNVVRWRTVAKIDPTGFVVRRWTQCFAG
jgi:hypothetical protein